MHLQPGRVVRQQRIGGGVRLVEAVARELLHQVEDLVGLRLRDALLRRALGKDGAVRHHLLELLLAHRAAQQVGAAERVAADDLRHLHHLLLVDHDPVGLLEHLLHQRVRVLHLLAAVLARAEARDQVHRARPVQGHERDHVLEHARLGVAQHALHAGRFELEHGDGLALAHQPVGAAVVERELVEREVLLVGVARDDVVLRELEDRQRREAQEVELDEADRFDVVLVELAHRAVAARLHVERAEVGDLAWRDQHAAGVHADVAHDAFHAFGQRQQFGHLFLVLLALLDLGCLAARVDHARVRVVRRAAQRHGLAGRRGHELGDAVDMAVTHAEHTAHVAQRGLRGHRAEGGDLAHGVTAVLLLHVVDHAVAVGLAEVDVEVGHRHAVRVQETLEQQLVAQRVEVGDRERVGDERACPRSPPRADRAAVGFRPIDEVGHDQEVAGKAHLQDRRDLELEPLHVTRSLGIAFRGIGVEVRQPRLQALVRGEAEVLGHRELFALDERRGEVRQLRFAEHELQAATACDLDRVAHGARQVREQRLHLRSGLEILLAAEALHAFRVRQRLAFGHADPRLMRFEVFGRRELHRVRGHHRQAQACGQRHRGAHVRLVARQAGALQFEVEASREQGREAQRE